MKIEVHSKDGCPYCVMAKDYLNKNNIPFDEIKHNDEEERKRFYDSLGLTERRERTVPQIILIENETSNRIGGYSDLIKSDLLSRYQVYVGSDDF